MPSQPLPSADPVLTVAVCTRDRVALINRTARAVIDECDPHEQVEVLFIDNGSTDSTVAALASLVNGHPRAKVAVEADPGLSAARNRALQESCARYVAYIDDDALPEPGWCENILREVTGKHSLIAVAGRVRLATDDQTPQPLADLPPRVRGLLSGLDLGPHERQLTDNEAPVGANMVVERTRALAVGGFRKGLGRDGRSLLSMEEVDLFRRMRSGRDDRATWLPSASVLHLVSAERLTARYLVERAYWQGRSHLRIEGPHDKPRSSLRSTTAAVRHLAHVATTRGKVARLDRALDAAFELGRARERAHQKRQHPKQILSLSERAPALLGHPRLHCAEAVDFEVCAIHGSAPAREHLETLSRLRNRHVAIHIWSLVQGAELHDAEIVGHGPGTKFDLVRTLAARCAPESDLLIIDDDVAWTYGSPGELVALARHCGFVLAQPAHAFRSRASHAITVGRPHSWARQTTFVEIGPVLYVRGRERDRFLAPDIARGMGYGTELNWMRLAQRSSLSIGIVDAVRIRHLKPVGRGYDVAAQRGLAQAMLAEAGLGSWSESQQTCARWRERDPTPPWTASR